MIIHPQDLILTKKSNDIVTVAAFNPQLTCVVRGHIITGTYVIRNGKVICCAHYLRS